MAEALHTKIENLGGEIMTLTEVMEVTPGKNSLKTQDKPAGTA